MAYQCATCGEMHEGIPDVGFEWPDPYFGVPGSERERRIHGTTDTCVIDDENFFIRGVLVIPIRGENTDLGLGVWVSQKRENFEKYLANFDTPDIGPFFGWLCNRIPCYEKALAKERKYLYPGVYPRSHFLWIFTTVIEGFRFASPFFHPPYARRAMKRGVLDVAERGLLLRDADGSVALPKQESGAL